MKTRRMQLIRFRNRERTHLYDHTLAAYPAVEVSLCGVWIRAARVLRLEAHYDQELTCPACRKRAPWLARGASA
jgi:hypothetical protein